MLSEEAPHSRDGGGPADVAFDVAHALAPVQATQLDGQPVRMGTLWEQRAAVLVFLRHFG